MEIYQLLIDAGHKFLINRLIHLKVVLRDKKDILIGSANITGRGLGFLPESNIEAIAIMEDAEEYTGELERVLRLSTVVDDEIFSKLKVSAEKFLPLRDELNSTSGDMAKLDSEVIAGKEEALVAADFPFCKSPAYLIDNIKSDELEVTHDRHLFGPDITIEGLKKSFLDSKAYQWQLGTFSVSTLFGKYSAVLHNDLADDPRPYRRDVKELVSNIFKWTEEFSEDFTFEQHNHSRSIKRR